MPQSGGPYIIREYIQQPACDGGIDDELLIYDSGAFPASSAVRAHPVSPASVNSNPAHPRVDLLFLYTPEARAEYGPSGVHAIAITAIGFMNSALVNSGATVTLHLLSTLETSWKHALDAAP